MANVRAIAAVKSQPELRIPNAAAQTRIVSGGEFWPSRRELSRYLKYLALARIPEFESSHPSQAVCLCGPCAARQNDASARPKQIIARG
jgi:hypothetical protein